MLDSNYEIDWSHPLTQGLRHVWLLGEGNKAVCLVSGVVATKVGSTANVINKNGREASMPSASDYWQVNDDDFADEMKQTNVTIIGRGFTSGATSVTALVSYGGSGGSDGWSLRGEQYNAANQMGMSFGGSDKHASSLIRPPTERCTWGGSLTPSDLIIAKSGITYRQAGGTGSVPASNGRLVLGANVRYSSVSSSIVGGLDLVFIYDRGLTVAEMSEITIDPEVILSSSPRRILSSAPDANNPVTGSVTISGSTLHGNALTMSDTLADADGLGTFTRSWLRDDVAISGETGTTYTTTTDDIGAEIKAKINYTDLLGNPESATSAAHGPITGDPNAQYNECYVKVTINAALVDGANKTDFKPDFSKIVFPSGFVAKALADGENVRVYTSSDFIDANRVSIDPTVSWNTVAETVGWVGALPLVSASVDTDFYVVIMNPSYTLPADAASFGKDEVTAATTLPNDGDLTTTLASMASDPLFFSAASEVCVTMNGSDDEDYLIRSDDEDYLIRGVIRPFIKPFVTSVSNSNQRRN